MYTIQADHTFGHALKYMIEEVWQGFVSIKKKGRGINKMEIRHVNESRHGGRGPRTFRSEPGSLLFAWPNPSLSNEAVVLPSGYRGGSSTTSAPSSVYTVTGARPPSWCTT